MNQHEDDELMDDAEAGGAEEPLNPHLKTLRLHPKIARRVERGHLWVFSNEVQAETGDPLPGDEVAVVGRRGRFVGMGLYSKSSLIRARIYSRRKGEPCDGALIRRRLEEALAYRRAVGAAGQSYRLIHGEADGLPGVVIDVFGDQAVVQIATAGMDARREALVEALQAVISPAAIVERSDLPVRALEGLPETKGILFGEPTVPCRVEEEGVVALADLLEGQKTGYYLDQAANRRLARPLLAGRRVLDLFCYVGAWSLMAAAAGATEALGLDSSDAALTLARRALELNPGASGRCRFEKADVFARLREMSAAGERYDAVILDPPPLAKSRRDAREALRGYRELNLRAMRLLAPGGLLVTCSCSHAVSEEDFAQTLTLAARDARCDFSVLARPTQPADHSAHLATPETLYLKTWFLVKRDF